MEMLLCFVGKEIREWLEPPSLSWDICLLLPNSLHTPEMKTEKPEPGRKTLFIYI